MAENCGSANIKAAGITIYTVEVNTGRDPTSSLLQNCASDSNKFWMLTSASAISKNRRRRNRADGSGLVRRWRAFPVGS